MCMAQSFTQAYDNRQDQPDNYFLYFLISYFYYYIFILFFIIYFFFFLFIKLYFFPFLSFIIPNNILQLTILNYLLITYSTINTSFICFVVSFLLSFNFYYSTSFFVVLFLLSLLIKYFTYFHIFLSSLSKIHFPFQYHFYLYFVCLCIFNDFLSNLLFIYYLLNTFYHFNSISFIS